MTETVTLVGAGPGGAALLTRGGFPNAAGWAYNGVSLFSEEMECIFLRKTSKRITA